ISTGGGTSFSPASTFRSFTAVSISAKFLPMAGLRSAAVPSRPAAGRWSSNIRLCVPAGTMVYASRVGSGQYGMHDIVGCAGVGHGGDCRMVVQPRGDVGVVVEEGDHLIGERIAAHGQAVDDLGLDQHG